MLGLRQAARGDQHRRDRAHHQFPYQSRHHCLLRYLKNRNPGPGGSRGFHYCLMGNSYLTPMTPQTTRES